MKHFSCLIVVNLIPYVYFFTTMHTLCYLSKMKEKLWKPGLFSTSKDSRVVFFKPELNFFANMSWLIKFSPGNSRAGPTVEFASHLINPGIACTVKEYHPGNYKNASFQCWHSAVEIGLAMQDDLLRSLRHQITFTPFVRWCDNVYLTVIYCPSQCIISASTDIYI